MTLNLTRQKSLLDRFTASVIRQNDLKHVKLRDTEKQKGSAIWNYRLVAFAKKLSFSDDTKKRANV